MLNAIYALFALALLAIGIYAAFAGSVALCLGVGTMVDRRLTRPLCGLVILIGVAIYLAGNMMLVDAMRVAP